MLEHGRNDGATACSDGFPIPTDPALPTAQPPHRRTLRAMRTVECRRKLTMYQITFLRSLTLLGRLLARHFRYCEIERTNWPTLIFLDLVSSRMIPLAIVICRGVL